MRHNTCKVTGLALITLFLGLTSCKPKNAGNAVSANAAERSFVAPGKYDEF